MGWKEEPSEQQKPGLRKRLLSRPVPKVWAESRKQGVHQAGVTKALGWRECVKGLEVGGESGFSVVATGPS